MKELETVVQDEKNKWILITGILQVLACVIMNKFDISNPNIILFVILSAVLVQFGYGAGMLCGFITYIYSMYFFSTDHSFFYFDASNRDKIMVVIFGIIANILIVGSLKARMEKSNKERIHQLEVATTLNKCAVELSADRDIHTAIYNLLGIINQYFQADRSYIFDIDHEKQIVINTYEYTAEGVTRQIDNLQSVPLSVIAVWMDKFENGQVYYIADAEQEKGYPTYEMLVEQNIKRLLTVPLKKNGKVTGFIGVDNAGFEMELSSGKHLLVDPWLDEAQIYPISIDEIERADYVLLTHTHDDHSDSIGRIQKRFPQAAIFVGDLSAEALCKEYDLNVERLFRIRGGEEYEFDDVKIEVISARHTESKGGNYWDRGYCIQKDGSRRETMWYGSLEMYNFRITDVNGYRAVVWGGMTTEEQIHRMEKYSGNEIAFMHVSPKQDHQMFARLVQAINPKAVIPHHYDIWETLFAAKPELLADMKLPADKVNAEGVLDVIRQNIKENCPDVAFFIPEHHKWYQFGYGIMEA
jgi:L-ascorbate metabolism protein UlaG (beta-lactamase superfamily)